MEYLAVRRALKAAKKSEESAKKSEDVAERIIEGCKATCSPYHDGEGCQTTGARTTLSKGYGRYTTETAGFVTAPPTSAGVEPFFAEEYHRVVSAVDPHTLDENLFLKGCQ